eukprot:TRINITY_DN13302_c0_g1_i2.p1 TRINITY_DN13302_c0_g1~~TRINITY_DN13302_c0_g1_i2.p1  ORF type:complete len:289 (-),score=53.26 TRINITY_DN13302_c0_g1_i2:344-1210(-)
MPPTNSSAANSGSGAASGTSPRSSSSNAATTMEVLPLKAPSRRNPRANDIDPGHECEHEHFSHRAPWLRAGLLGAQDGLVSVASLMVGVGAVKKDKSSMVVSGLAGMVAGALSMAIGEYISVYGQRDTEEADVEKERLEFAKGPEAVERETQELTNIYIDRGLSRSLARQVADELTRVDPIRAHARDELGIDLDDLSNPLQAAATSACAFLIGAAIPLLSASFIGNSTIRLTTLVLTSTAAFLAFGWLGAWLGGAKAWKACLRSLVGGWAAMLVTYGILRAFGTSGGA